MAKKFMYVCLGILALTAAFHLGAQYGMASIVDHSGGGVIACSGTWVLMDDGEVWAWDNEYGWLAGDPGPLPVSPSAVKFWDAQTFVTSSNELWIWYGTYWHNCGAPPGGIATQSTTWSQIKAEFGE